MADITEELYASGELGQKLDDALGIDRERTVKVVDLAGAGRRAETVFVRRCGKTTFP